MSHAQQRPNPNPATLPPTLAHQPWLGCHFGQSPSAMALIGTRAQIDAYKADTSHPTSGFNGIALALHICETIDIYGFGSPRDAKMPAQRPPPKMIVEIVFADNRTEHIEVRDGDDPSQLARQFLATYKLPASYEKVLREQIVASIAEDERQRQLQKPAQDDDDDEGAVSPDDDEDAYNAARQSFSAAQTKPRVKRASLVWRSGKQGATKVLPRRQRETCARLHRDAARQRRRRVCANPASIGGPSMPAGCGRR